MNVSFPEPPAPQTPNGMYYLGRAFREFRDYRPAWIAAVIGGLMLASCCCSGVLMRRTESGPSLAKIVASEVRVRPQVDGKPVRRYFTKEEQLLVDSVKLRDWKHVSKDTREMVLDYVAVAGSDGESDATIATRRDFLERFIDVCADEPALDWRSVKSIAFEGELEFSIQVLELIRD